MYAQFCAVLPKHLIFVNFQFLFEIFWQFFERKKFLGSFGSAANCLGDLSDFV